MFDTYDIYQPCSTGFSARSLSFHSFLESKIQCYRRGSLLSRKEGVNYLFIDNLFWLGQISWICIAIGVDFEHIAAKQHPLREAVRRSRIQISAVRLRAAARPGSPASRRPHRDRRARNKSEWRAEAARRVGQSRLLECGHLSAWRPAECCRCPRR